MNGLTLIELSVVLAVMATLTAVMLPRFLELQRMARIGNLRSVHGTMAVASTLVHVGLITRGGSPDTKPCTGGGTADNRLAGPGTQCTDHGLVHTLNGYAASLPLGKAGIVSATGLTTAFNPTAEQLLASGYRVSVAGGVTTVARADAGTPDHCSFTYTQAASLEKPAVVSTPIVDGC